MENIDRQQIVKILREESKYVNNLLRTVVKNSGSVNMEIKHWAPKDQRMLAYFTMYAGIGIPLNEFAYTSFVETAPLLVLRKYLALYHYP